MKSIFLAFTLIFCVNITAQDFQYFINPNYEYYFEYDEDPGVYHTFSVVDSLINSESKSYFGHKIKRNDYLLTSSNDSCMIYHGPNVFGHEIKQDLNQNWILKNEWNDSLYLSLDIAIGDSVSIFSKNDLNYFWYRNNNGSGGFLGQTIPFLQFQLKKFQSGVQIDSKIDSLNFKYSQDDGFLNFFDVYQFPNEEIPFTFVGEDSFESGPRLVSNKDLPSWEINDILLYKYVFTSIDVATIFYRHTIDSISETSEKLVYYTSVLEQSIFPYNTIEYEYYNDSIIYLAEDSIFNFPLSNLNNDEVYIQNYRDTLFNTIERQYFEKSLIGFLAGSNCFLPIWEGTGTEVYIEGLGFFYSSSNDGSDFPPTGYSTRLIAYKKGNEIYGDPYQITGNQEITQNRISIYPNPTKNIVRFEIDLDQFELFDLRGKIVLDGSGQKADLSFLENGIYILKVHKDDSIYSQKIIKN